MSRLESSSAPPHVAENRDEHHLHRNQDPPSQQFPACDLVDRVREQGVHGHLVLARTIKSPGHPKPVVNVFTAFKNVFVGLRRPVVKLISNQALARIPEILGQTDGRCRRAYHDPFSGSGFPISGTYQMHHIVLAKETLQYPMGLGHNSVGGSEPNGGESKSPNQFRTTTTLSTPRRHVQNPTACLQSRLDCRFLVVSQGDRHHFWNVAGGLISGIMDPVGKPKLSAQPDQSGKQSCGHPGGRVGLGGLSKQPDPAVPPVLSDEAGFHGQSDLGWVAKFLVEHTQQEGRGVQNMSPPILHLELYIFPSPQMVSRSRWGEALRVGPEGAKPADLHLVFSGIYAHF